VTDLTLAYLFPGTPGYRAYLSVENLTDKVYASTVSTIGYATGAPRRVSLGIQASF
jgi:outer membrane receptor protein involved in Fe transport